MTLAPFYSTSQLNIKEKRNQSSLLLQHTVPVCWGLGLVIFSSVLWTFNSHQYLGAFKFLLDTDSIFTVEFARRSSSFLPSAILGDARKVSDLKHLGILRNITYFNMVWFGGQGEEWVILSSFPWVKLIIALENWKKKKIWKRVRFLVLFFFLSLLSK